MSEAFQKKKNERLWKSWENIWIRGVWPGGGSTRKSARLGVSFFARSAL